MLKETTFAAQEAEKKYDEVRNTSLGRLGQKYNSLGWLRHKYKSLEWLRQFNSVNNTSIQG